MKNLLDAGCDMSVWPQEKPCSNCKEVKLLKDFGKLKVGRFNRKSTCKACDSIYRREHIEEARIRQANWREKNPDYMHDYMQNWWKENPNYKAEYELENAEALTEWRREYRDLNREHLNEYNRNYRLANPEQDKAKQRRYRQKHPEVYTSPAKKAAHHRRRSILLGLTEHHTAQEWTDLCALYNYTCLCCGRSIGELDDNGKIIIMTPDHIVPLSRGGSNTIDNIQPLCLLCNNRKLAKTIDYRPESQVSLDVA